MSSSSAAEACVAAYSSATVYTGGQRASHTGHNWTATWWTQGETPSTGGSGVRAGNGACGGTGGLECNGRNPAQVQSRVDAYNRFTAILGVSPGANLYC